MRLDWDKYFMLIAKLVAQRSTCLSRKVGCVIVKDKRILATGYNGAPSGALHCSELGYCFRRKHGLPREYCRSIHAEQNAIAQAARMGIAVDGASIYVTLEPCPNCLKLLASAGIKRVYYEMPYVNYSSNDPIKNQLLTDAGFIEFKQITIPKNELDQILSTLKLPTSISQFDI